MAGSRLAPPGAVYPRIDVDDVQGIAIRGYGHLDAAAFMPFTIQNVKAARCWLALATYRGPNDKRQESLITSARPRHLDAAVNIAFTRAGLETLGLSKDTLALFSREFDEGMAKPLRSEFLGDVGDDAPSKWKWGADPSKIHGVLMVFGRKEAELEQAELFDEGFHAIKIISTRQQKLHEHFGFRDGISQPHLRHDNPADEVAGVLREGPDANAVNAGEFLLGYLDEFGCRQPSPLLPANADVRRSLVRGEDGFPDFGRNGTYLVLRQLEQKVFEFWNYVREAGAKVARSPVELAAKMVGRWPTGAPLALHPNYDPGPGSKYDNDFGYGMADSAGSRCPIGAHVRRSNPRDAVEKGPTSSFFAPEPFDRPTRIANRHRLIRRGRPYGSYVPEEVLERLQTVGQASIPPDGSERGLVFAAVMGSIRRQFEFVQTTWCNNPDFQGLVREPDPIVGSRRRGESASFTIQDDVPARIHDVPRFINMKGGGYFFMPSLRALRYLANTPD